MPEVTVFYAIRRGRRVVIPGFLFLFIGGLFLAIWLVDSSGMPIWCLAPALLFSVAASSLAGIWLNTEWWIWAIQHVRNVHELKFRAISSQLMAEDGNWRHKIWFKTPGQKRRLRDLAYKFDIPDDVPNDTSVPPRTEVAYDKRRIVAEMVFETAMIAGLLYLVSTGAKHQIFLVIFAVYIVYRIFRCVRVLQSTDAPLAIGNEGIRIKNVFKKWEEVRALAEPDYQNSDLRIYFEASDRPDALDYESIGVGNLQITEERLAHLLIVYRHRFIEKTEGANYTGT